MAAFPCDFCGRRYSGKQNTVYPALISGINVARFRGRICPDCLDGFEASLEPLVEATDRLGDTRACAKCRTPGDPLAAFITTYCRGADREDFFFRICRPCAAGGALAALVPPQSRLLGALDEFLEAG